MSACRHCGADNAVDELVRHERPSVVLVHCPDCERPLGRYRRHGDDPDTDARRE